MVGRLDLDALQRALQGLVDRHEALRTTFETEDGHPVQVVASAATCSLARIELTSLDRGEREPAMHRIASEEARRPFDLERGPLFRASLLKLDEKDHLLVVAMHHIVSGGWSIGVLVHDLTVMYDDFRAQRGSSLPQLPIQYADYAVWLRDLLTEEVVARHLRHWSEHLAGAQLTLELPTDRPRPLARAFRGARRPIRFEPDIVRALRDMARRENVTMFSALLAAFAIVLSRITGQPDLVIGIPIANRTRPETEGLVGLFANALALRADLSDNPTVHELLGRLREVMLQAHAHQDLPFERLVEELQPQRDLGRTPVFQVMLALQNTPLPVMRLSDLHLTVIPLDTETAKFDLTLDVREVGDTIVGDLEYDVDLFEEATIARVAARLTTVLRRLPTSADVRVDALPLIDAEERRWLLVECNATRAVLPGGARLFDAFLANAEATPHAVALVVGDDLVTYRALLRRANRPAPQLVRLGVRRGTLVGVCLERSSELVVALLAVMLAGGAYVPLDPKYPEDRLRYMLVDGGARIVVAEHRHASRVAGDDRRVLLVDSEAAAIAAESDSSPASSLTPDDLVYVLYTSGSTGAPKGVAITHRSAVALVHWARGVYGDEDLAGVLAATSVCFDLSVFELFVPLSWGGRVVLADNVLSLVGLPAAACVTLVNTVPSAIAELVRSSPLPASVVTVNLAGEPLKEALVADVLRAGARRVFDLYGPSEDTTYSTFASRTGSGRATIGRPITNTQVYILDRRCDPVPAGAVGEIHVAGQGLARGYLGRPDLTAQRFLPNPFSEEPGTRMYATGDLGRWLASGDIEFLGRRDHQVKVRGFRIELGEIEAAIAAHPRVRDVVAVAREDVPGDKRIVAYVVPDGGDLPADLKPSLRTRLPEFMIPAAFVLLQALPLTPNGKVDRRALPRPAPLLRDDDYVAPRPGVEELLASAWADILGVERVGAHDDFFELGGHSLLAMQVVSRLRQVLDVELPLRALFEASTVAGLAERIEATRHHGGARRPPISRRERVGSLELSFSQERLWFLEQLDPGTAVYNIPVAVRMTGRLDGAALEKSIQEVVRRHESLRTSFGSNDGRPTQLVHDDVTLAVPTVDLRSLPHDEQERRVRAEASAEAALPFDLTAAPLLRAKLLRLTDASSVDERHLLLVTIHHIVSDGWSIGVLVREIAAAYQAFASGDVPRMPELPVQYADYAAWQREWLQGEVLDAQLAYWTARLKGAAPALELPTDRVRPPTQTYRGELVSLDLPRDLVTELAKLGRVHGATLFMTTLAAFKLVLARWSGSRDIVVGAPVANRTARETEGLIGFFLNSVVLRTDLSGDVPFGELVARVRDTCLGAYAHQELPFERLTEALRPPRDMSRTPIFQVLFNMLNYQLRLELPGLQLEALPEEVPGAKLDLTLYLREVDGGLHLYAVYNSDLFDRARIEELLAQFEHVLRQAAYQPERTIESFELVTERARAVLPDPGLPLDASWLGAVHERFAVHAARDPDSTAVRDARETWTYGELDRRSNQLAHRLIAGGVRRGDVVAVYAHRSASLVWAVLGILKAGCAFMMLDPAYPPGRLIEFLTIAKPRALVQLEAAGAIPGVVDEHATRTATCRVALPTRQRADATGLFAALPVTAPDVTTSADDLACVAFTSGSTGGPKGVLGRHGSLTHFLPWLERTFALASTDRFSMLSGLAHDPLQRDMFIPLQLGATIEVPDPDIIGMPGRLAEWARDRGVTVSHLTPAMGQLLAEVPPEAPDLQIPSLRRAFFVGDVLLKRDLRRLRRLAPEVTCINYYGATETQRALGYYVVSEEELLEGASSQKEIVPIGRGMEDVQLLVLNGGGALAGVGEAGEIFVRSPHIALGYLGNADLTAERFVQNHLGATTGDRMYRTGDLGRYLADGNVEPLGRADRQVKIRGFRVELGEIEALLGKHPAIGDAAVIAREDTPGEKRLVAYTVLGDAAEAPTARDLRTYLKEQLPEYMVPSAFVVLQALPLTPNGKLDRAALPAPDMRSTHDGEYVAPRSPVEETLAGIWAEVLGVPRVGVHDDFFELGGHSLRITQVVARVRSAFKVELPLRAAFESSTVAKLAQKVEEALGAGALVDVPPIVPVPRDEVLALSFAQERIWFLDQLARNTPLFNMPSALRVEGPLDVEALQRSLREVVRRHEALRTTFTAEDGIPRQVVHPYEDFEVSLVDLTGLEPAHEEQAVRREALADVRRPFDLVQGPLFRIKLMRLASNVHVLFTTIHHVVFDGWSAGVFMREVAALYEAFANGRPSPLHDLPIQYADYAQWQRRWLRGSELQRQLDYWRRHLEGATAALELPTDRPRPRIQTFRGAQRKFELSLETANALRELSRREGVTLYMTLLAAYQTLLFRLSGQGDIVVGTPIANRTHTDVEGLIGVFVNTLVLRTILEPDLSFRELLARVNEVTLGAYACQDLPVEVIMAELHPERDLSRNALYQAWFGLRAAKPLSEGAGLRIVPLDIENALLDTATAKFDLFLNMAEVERGLVGLIEYNTDLFDGTTIDRWIGHFQTLLEAVVVMPQTRLVELPLLTERERAELIGSAIDARRPASSRCVHELFDERAAATPNAVAVTAAHVSLTYAELARRANRLAHQLREVGVVRGDLVAIGAGRTPALVVAVLATLKAGAAYLPLDATDPSERLAYIMNDATPRVVLTDADNASLLPSTGVPALDIDQASRRGDASRDAPPAGHVGPSDRAYVIYTSGSTGWPKGVELHHGGLTNLVERQIEAFGITAEGRVLQFAALSFDAMVSEVFTTLIAGAELVLERRDAMSPGAPLAGLLRERAISVVTLPPTALVETPADHLDALETVVSAGEACPSAVVARWKPGRRFLNAYGPTEITVCATIHECDADVASPPIGRALPNASTYVLDGAEVPAPTGVAGELCVGGVGVAHGYLGRPDLTAEKFVPDPFAGVAGARMYRTGDVVRRRRDGALEYVGRGDAQVKIRGFRVELGGIEAILARHPSVAAAAVVARTEDDGRKRLVGYVGRRGDAPPTTSALRAFLLDRLPEHAVPGTFIVLDALPLTSSGKIDRRALPAPDDARPELEQPYVAPRNDVEKALAAIWSRLLGVRRVGIHDNFFDLGGHSLLVTQVVSRVRQELAVDVPLVALFEAPTVVGLAARVEAALLGGRLGASPPIARIARGGPIPLSFGQERLWFLEQLEPDATFNNIPLAIAIAGRLDVAALRESLVAVVRRHEVLRTSFAVRGGVPEQVIAEEAGLPLPVLDLTQVSAAERTAGVQVEAAREARMPFDLARGPLLRARMVKLGEQEHVLLLTLHHIVADGWSLGVLVREATTLYLAHVRGDSSTLPGLPVQYADYAAWQRTVLASSSFETDLAYWKDRLGGVTAALELPTDRPRPPTQSFRGARHRFEVPPITAAALNTLAREQGATLYMTLLAAFNVLLSRLSGEETVLVGTPIANRTQAELEPLIGFFVNTIVIRTDLRGAPSFSELVARVRAEALGAYRHQHLPFEKLVEELRPPRDLSRHPLFQVMFVLQNTPVPTVELSGLRMAPMPLEAVSSKFDLTLEMVESEGRLLGSFEYATDLFDVTTIERLSALFVRVLEVAVEAPDRPIEAVALSTAGEQRRLVASIATDVATPCVHVTFAEHAARQPDAVAVVHDERTVTYRALDRASNRVARHLLRLGVTRGALVGCFLERSVETAVALLGIWKARAAYLPLDPAYPVERLRFMIGDARPAVVLAQRHLVPRVPATSAPVLAIDDDALWSGESGSRLEDCAQLDDLAYVIYTSGSTGQPKGVALDHRGLSNVSAEQIRSFGVGPGSRVLQFASPSFDASVFEMVMALAAGATLHPASRDARIPGAELHAQLREQRISVVTLPPSSLAVMSPAELDELAVVTVAGEACPADLVHTWAQTRRFFNLYGPTEATIWTTIAECKDDGQKPPIGTPIANVDVLVIDRSGNPVPVGVAGELFVGGRGVARGYVGRPDLTAERFVPHPFSEIPGARMYRTGDLVRLRPDGQIDFLGRIDEQVKLRGFRIELGEIEAVIREDERVADCAVVVQGGGDAARLVAFVVPVTVGTPPDDVRDRLRTKLPDYMIPSAVASIERLPTTPNGKVDRKVLAARVLAEGGGGTAPRNDLERRLLDVWQRVLGAPGLGVTESFFDAGGHSLLAVRLLAAVEDEVGMRVPLASLFATPTVEGLARVVSGTVIEDRIDLRREAILEEGVRPNAPDGLAPRSDDVFLTGATGFVGAFLLHELLRATTGQVHCLVRAKTVDDGRRKIEKALQSYRLSPAAVAERVVPVLGDLAEPSLGVDPAELARLAGRVGEVFHNGALVNFVEPYARLKPANIEGTREILRFVTSGRAKSLHYVSTLSVFSPWYAGRHVAEGEEAAHQDRLAGGYPQSKWVAERLVLEAQARGVPVRIHRPGRVTGDSNSGASNIGDFTCTIVKAFVLMGAAPDIDMSIEMTPVDYVARAIVELARRDPSTPTTHHLVNPRPATLRQIVEFMQSLGYEVRLEPLDVWRARLNELGRGSAGLLLGAVLAVLGGDGAGPVGVVPAGPARVREPEFACDLTMRALAGSGIECPPVDDRLLTTYFDYLIDIGFLERPVAPDRRRAGDLRSGDQ